MFKNPMLMSFNPLSHPMVQVMPDSACRPDTAWKIKGKQICALGEEDVFLAPFFYKGTVA
jgi:hypothetical protein